MKLKIKHKKVEPKSKSINKSVSLESSLSVGVHRKGSIKNYSQLSNDGSFSSKHSSAGSVKKIDKSSTIAKKKSKFAMLHKENAYDDSISNDSDD